MTAKNADGRNRRSGLRRPILGATILLVSILTVLSIFGAFIGADRAAQFFGSIPLAAFWITLAVLLCAGFVLLANLRKKPGLLLSHMGCLLVLMGALWGSETAHELRAKHLDSDRAASGYMKIHEGHQSDSIVSGDGRTVLATLPFAVALEDFWIEYYDAEGGALHVAVAGGAPVQLPAVAGEKLVLGNELPTVEIMRVFRNFRINIAEGKKDVTDDPGAGSNPALSIELTDKDGAKSQHYVFTGAMRGHGFSYEGLDLIYHQASHGGIKDYKSALTVLQDDKPIKKQIIEVNKPLSYGGYSFYQTGYDQERGAYTVLSVTSSSGLLLVFLGYALLCVGVIWQCWLRHLSGYLRGRT